MQTAIRSLHHILRPEIKRGGINRGKRQGRSPRVTILALIDLGFECKRGPWSNILAQARPFVEAGNGTVSPTQINDVGVVRIEHQVSAFAGSSSEPVPGRDLIVVGAAYNRGAATILLRAIHDVGKLVVGSHMIELRRRLVVPTAPGQAPIEADRGSLVRSEDHAGGISGIDPKLVIIIAAGRAAQHRNCLPSILRSVESDIRHIDHIGIVRIDRDAVEVPCPAGQPRIGIRECPCIPSIVRPIEAGFLRFGFFRLGFFYFDKRIYALAIRRNVNTNASPIAFGQPVADEPGPGFASILRTVKAATRSIDRGIRAPRRTPRMPCSGKQKLGRGSAHG